MRDLSVGDERKRILYFALPMLIGNVFQLMYNVVDRWVVGQYVGKQALAAVGASFPIIFVMISFFIGIAMGFTIAISQYFGSKNIEKVRRTIDTLYIMMFFASVLISIVGIFFSEQIFQLINLPVEVRPEANTYFKIYMAGVLLFFGFSGTSAILRGLGDSKTPLYFMVLATVANVAFDILFVLGFGMGVEGVALATIISQGGAFVTAIFYLNRTHEVINLSWRKMIFDMDVFRKSVKIGAPIGGQHLFVSLGMSVMFVLVNPFGTDAVAAYTTVFTISSFVSMPAMNFTNALSTFVGQNLGANKPQRVHRGLMETFKMVSVLVVVITAIAIIFRRELVGIFTDDQNVINIGAEYLSIVGWFFVAFSSMFVIGGVMRGAGDTLVPMIITFISLWVVRIPACYLLSLEYGVTGIWWGIPIAWLVGLVLSFLYYLTGRWKKKAIVKHDQA
ncbi:MAG: MATE family efflux transporter [Bacteroidales bacterium]|nr:MATE family efflux transporter [Bacteroidales bacterium]MCF8352494.1 MATE family efflux transporter [Bacteroidales bacterium]MCF8375427.1 MATE family efflux transporter [Bacteroidales bacterium]MCF8400975.1 MATE family efflux transporter [Bacteroidales bacterium]